MIIKSVDYKFDDGKILNVKYDEYQRTLMSKEFVEQVVIPALEKQIPKKPQPQREYIVEGRTFYDDYRCPNCNNLVMYDIEGTDCTDYQEEICQECGQALDWGK